MSGSDSNSDSNSSSETETDEEPEYPVSNKTEDTTRISKRDPLKRAQRFRTGRRPAEIAFSSEDLADELDIQNKVEAKCGAPQVLTFG